MNQNIPSMKKGFFTILLVFGILSSYSQEGAFVNHQSVFNHGANDFKTFEIAGETYLAIANFTENESTELNSTIYRWENDEFQLFQEIATKGASDWEFFTVGNTINLAVANYEDDESNTVNSVIYKWIDSQFVFHQNIETVGAYDFEFFLIEEIPFLAAANQTNGDSSSIPSVIYQWDGEFFQDFQSILTNGATDWKSFTIGNEIYLAIANVLDLNTEIYKWDGSTFVLFQNLGFTLFTTGIESFTIDNNIYLSLSSGSGISDYNSISKLYVWQDSIFVPFQEIATIGAFDWEYFSMNEEHYLVVANYKEGEEDYDVNSEIFHWNGDEFVSFQTIYTHAAVDWEYCEIEGENYLMVAEYKDGENHSIYSRIFRFEENVFVSEKSNNNSILIYPNPTQSILNIEIPDNSHQSQILVEDLKGNILLNEKGSAIDVSLLAKGVYLIQIISQKENYSLRFVKE